MLLEPSPNVVQEHKFYESGNIKHLLPLMNLQNYETTEIEEPSGISIYGWVFLILVIVYIAVFMKRRKFTEAERTDKGHLMV
ncbi:hypothetical protein PSN45_000651 [Yamadazyma tenuis]|uniref:Uncharacterized protein n=1 Tax=Candida tenuis (strain ATCC 10573 / BCRC 21748 / CBS 615 / JCM 9827 / NBRC 10315 / NRRL Y-1498 / VKM Y-70) TaxID=590646 RepID=G3B9Q6_CANTC|nr:uncharacterized protein CANTEDRAFT_115402 [Yamadazyma tenuis ATCC 10573]EGV61947.1 hypothetical protein CANTEDRAFT_115402 [Yamadazyma tenuis ATCC 10573]WEJ93190.1 hypothetical protein PSN45_000651 [Yamadazyma tenuis]